MKKIAEVVLMLVGVVVFFFGLFHVDFWGMLLGIGLVFAPLTTGSMFLMYVALVGIPFGLGVVFALVAKAFFGKGLTTGFAFFVGLLLGGKFVISESFGLIFDKDRSDVGSSK